MLDVNVTDEFSAFTGWKTFDFFQASLDLTRGSGGGVNFVGRFLKFFLGGFKEVTKFTELSFNGAKNLPDFTTTLFNGNSAETHK